MEWLVLRKRADKSGPEPDLEAGEAWPLAGVELVGAAPKNAELSTGYVARGQGEGWIELGGLRLAEDPSGLWVHADEIILHLEGGAVRYKVVENPGYVADLDAPGDWPAEPSGPLEEPHRVEHRYLLKHVSGGRG